MPRLLLACTILLMTTAGYAQTQTTKPRSPGEMAAQDRVKAEKRADSTRQAKDKKLGLLARRKFVKACVGG